MSRRFERKSMSELYLYGVVRTGRPLTLSSEGVAGGVRLIAEGDLGVIVGVAPQSGFRGLAREQAVRLLIMHQQVLESAMAETTVLPIKFGATAPDEAAARRLIRRGGDLLRSRLDDFAGRRQVEIAVFWELDQIFAEIAQEAEIAQARAALQAGASQAERIQLGQKVEASLERRRRSLTEKLAAELKAVVRDIALNSLADNRMVANFALLLDAADIAALEETLNRLDADFDGRLRFRWVGPLPPVSFATVEVSFPSPQAIEHAKRTLNIQGEASRSEIVSAYRRLARETHPDAMASRRDAAQDLSQDANIREQISARMGELSDAYRLLMAHAKAQSSDAEAMADTVIVDIVRVQTDAGLAL
jgi:hypothetical protein